MQLGFPVLPTRTPLPVSSSKQPCTRARVRIKFHSSLLYRRATLFPFIDPRAVRETFARLQCLGEENQRQLRARLSSPQPCPCLPSRWHSLRLRRVASHRSMTV